MQTIPRRFWAALLVLLALTLGAVVWRRFAPPADPNRSPTTLSATEARKILKAVATLEARELEADTTHWAPDLQAQLCGSVFDSLWDNLNASTSQWEVVEAFAVPAVVLPQHGPPQRLPHGIERRSPTEPGQPVLADRWRRLVGQVRQERWRLAQVEFRHSHFTLAAGGRPPRSRFSFIAHLVKDFAPARAALSGDLVVDWILDASGDGPPQVQSIDASRVTLLTRTGAPPFELAFDETVAPLPKSPFIDPLIVHDLDGDGLAEIVLATRNLLYRRRAWDRFESEPLCRHPPGLIFTATVADFDGDGRDDFLGARFDGLVLFRGSERGTFDEPGQSAWAADPRLKYAQVLACGDVDRDGDLDVWLGQYKGPYDRGQMPTPYYDANDGHPAYLLLNEGDGRFRDATESAGLGAKRWRRSYSASFLDLDRDDDLDLLVVSDFAGVDVYANDGRGRFVDTTQRWLPERHAFGMAHTVADFDGDGRLDVLVMGMNCPTPQRLDALGLSRPERPDYATLRARMTAGNRLYQGQAGDGFAVTPLNESIARSGWSWGVSAPDFDNDGYADVFIATGHESKSSVRDYEAEFWRHDIYVGQSRDDAVAAVYFGAKGGRTRGQGQSYGGYEKNRVYWNQQGREFLEIGHLLGVALEADARNVVTDDLDGDGRMDLLVTTFEAWPVVRQTLRIYRNRLPDAGHWLGVRLAARSGGTSSVGAVVTLAAGGRRWLRPIVTGDSHRSQHASAVHFGLGAVSRVDSLAVRWPDGRNSRIEQPPVNSWIRVEPPPLKP